LGVFSTAMVTWTLTDGEKGVGRQGLAMRYLKTGQVQFAEV